MHTSLSNVLLTELIPASIPILVYIELISRVILIILIRDRRCFFTKLSCLFAIGFKWESIV